MKATGKKKGRACVLGETERDRERESRDYTERFYRGCSRRKIDTEEQLREESKFNELIQG